MTPDSPETSSPPSPSSNAEPKQELSFNKATLPPPAIPPSLLSQAKNILTTPPIWWKTGPWHKFLAFLCAPLAFNLAFYTHTGLGLGLALGILLFALGLWSLRKDISRKENICLWTFAAINASACVINGSLWSLWLSIGLLITFLLRSTSAQWGTNNPLILFLGVSLWWVYGLNKLKGILKRLGKAPLFIVSALTGIAVFLAFAKIIASNNPLVERLLSTWLEALGTLLADIFSSAFVAQMFLAFLGIFIFSFLTIQRRAKKEPQGVDTSLSSPQNPPTRPLLPAFALMVLLGINAAFLLSNGTDIFYLWRHQVPEGISRTEYLHEGANGLMFITGVASLVLLLLFRPNSYTRTQKPCLWLGYLLSLQCGLIALSVGLRLLFQIHQYGFTSTRLCAALCLMIGFSFLVCLFVYLKKKQRFSRFLKSCTYCLFFFLTFLQFKNTYSWSNDLNLLFRSSFPHWNFSLGYFAQKYAGYEELPLLHAVIKEHAYELESLQAKALQNLSEEEKTALFHSFKDFHFLDLPLTPTEAHVYRQYQAYLYLQNWVCEDILEKAARKNWRSWTLNGYLLEQKAKEILKEKNKPLFLYKTEEQEILNKKSSKWSHNNIFYLLQAIDRCLKEESESPSSSHSGDAQAPSIKVRAQAIETQSPEPQKKSGVKILFILPHLPSNKKGLTVLP